MTASTCAVGPCQADRAPGSSYCAKHGPKSIRPEAKGGSKDELIVCPHCQTRGRVTTRQVRRKKGISGGKATGALLTGGLSILATGLSRKEAVIELRCGACGVVWEA